MSVPETRACPYCNGEIKTAARICKHCKQPVPEPGPTSAGRLSEDEENIKQLVVSRGLLTPEQFDGGIATRKATDADLLDLLQRKGLLTAAQVQAVHAALKVQMLGEARRLGDLAVQRLMLSQEQVDGVVAEMEAMDQLARFGDVVVKKGLVTRPQWESLKVVGAEKPAAAPKPVAVGALREKGMFLVRKFLALPRKVQIGIPAAVVLVVVLFVAFGRSEIKVECSLNRFGKGECAFTNSGSSGSVCGHLAGRCGPGETAVGSTFCSGDVGKNETKTLNVSFVEFQDIAAQYGGVWRDKCDFFYIEK